MFPPDTGEPFDCSLDGEGNFDCPDRAQITDATDPTAVFTLDADVLGILLSDTLVDGQQDVAIDCTGLGCQVLENGAPTSRATTPSSSSPATFATSRRRP